MYWSTNVVSGSGNSLKQNVGALEKNITQGQLDVLCPEGKLFSRLFVHNAAANNTFEIVDMNLSRSKHVRTKECNFYTRPIRNKAPVILNNSGGTVLRNYV